MILLRKAISAWGTPGFFDALKQELMQLDIGQLPLQRGISSGSYVIDAPITATNIAAVETDEAIRVRTGIFFQTVIAGCSCADDPTPENRINEYCEVQLIIDKATAKAMVSLIE